MKKAVFKSNRDGNDFSIMIPAKIEKAKGKNGKIKMRIKGFASDDLEDDEGQTLDPKGFVYDDLIKTGTFNWQHQSHKIIGHPDKARVTSDNKFYVEGPLYKSRKLSKEIYEVQKALEEEGDGRTLTLSIEGKALELDPLNENKVTKAKIRDIAICTPSTPINKRTSVSIIKGAGVEYDVFKGECGSKCIFEVRGKAHRYVVTPNGELIKSEINKAFSAEDENADAVKKESIDGVIKKKCGKNFDKKKKKHNIRNIKMNKAEIYSEIFNFVSDIDQAKNIYKAIKVLNMKKSSASDGITKDDLKKGLEVIKELGNAGLDNLMATAVGPSVESGVKLLKGMGTDKSKKEYKEALVKAEYPEEMVKGVWKQFKGIIKGDGPKDITKMDDVNGNGNDVHDDPKKGKKKKGTKYSSGLKKAEASVVALRKAVAKDETLQVALDQAMETVEVFKKAEAENANQEVYELIKANQEVFSGQMKSVGEILKTVLEKAQGIETSYVEMKGMVDTIKSIPYIGKAAQVVAKGYNKGEEEVAELKKSKKIDPSIKLHRDLVVTALGDGIDLRKAARDNDEEVEQFFKELSEFQVSGAGKLTKGIREKAEKEGYEFIETE